MPTRTQRPNVVVFSFRFVDAPPRAPFQERVTVDEYQQ